MSVAKTFKTFFRLMMIYFINKPSIWSFPSLIVILLQLVNLLDIAFFTTFEIHFLRSVIKFVVYIVHLSSMNHFLYRNIYPTYKMLFCSHFWLYIPLLLFQMKKKKIIFFHKVSFITYDLNRLMDGTSGYIMVSRVLYKHNWQWWIILALA